MKARIVCLGAGAAIAVAMGIAVAAQPPAASNATPPPSAVSCGPLRAVTDVGGLMDYRARFADSRVEAGIAQVNRYHTEPARANAAANPRDARIIADLDFTLRHSPNHVDALRLLISYDRSGGQSYEFPVECYLGWAQQFAPDDWAVMQMAAVYYARVGDVRKAEDLYLKAISLNPASVELHYLLGLFYAGQKRYEDSRKQARIAYAGGYPLAGLKNVLERANQWDSTIQIKSAAAR